MREGAPGEKNPRGGATVLTRKPGQGIMIGDEIEITVVELRLSSSFGGEGTGRIARLSRRFVRAGRSRLLCTV